MTRVLIFVVCMLLPVSRSEASDAVETEFARERERLTAFSGPTTEKSCSGTELVVYLKGEQVRHLDWTGEMSTQFVRRQYFFRGASPALVIETIHAKLGPGAEPLAVPQRVSTKRYAMDSARGKEFREHAEFLLRDFRQHRSEFTPAGGNNRKAGG